MSSIIRLLPDHIANQIAAGEVIQRPASVVKELLENAIDAGSTKIQLLIKQGGRTSIQVIDNGKGMSLDDAQLCFERHATSKLQVAEDLFCLTTKGFRGEALASVAAIAHVELTTKQADAELAIQLTVEASQIISTEKVTAPNGTSFSVKNLFYNVPARRNFLKSDAVENGHILSELERVALVHPEIEFIYYNNDQLIYSLPADNQKKRIVDLFGKNYNDRLVPIETETDIVKITGFVLKPQFAKKSRGEQYFFVNNRFFKDSYLHHAVGASFEHLITEKSYPSYFIYLEVPPHTIDVNVHPTKTEIKFEEDRAVYQILRSSIKQALGKFHIAPSLDFSLNPDIEIPSFTNRTDAIAPTIQVNQNYNPFKSETFNSKSNSFRSSGFGSFKPAESKMAIDNFFEITQDEVQSVENDLAIENNKNTENLQFDGDENIEKSASKLFSSNESLRHFQHLFTGEFIVLFHSELILIHPKRARQRILYDQLMRTFIQQPISSQQLLFPLEKDFDPKEKATWLLNAKTISRIGFTWNETDEGIQISGIPAIVREVEANNCIDLLLHKLTNDELEAGEIAHTLINTLAVSASGSKINYFDRENREELVQQLFESSEPLVSPSGKKIITNLDRHELEERFI